MKQLTKRLPLDFIITTIQDFTNRKITEREACNLLTIKRARLYRIASKLKKQGFSRKVLIHGNVGRINYRYTPNETRFLTSELKYIAQESENFQGEFNFAYLAEKFEREFGKKTYRSSIRLFAIREGFYKPREKKEIKVFRRFDTGNIGQLYQHDTSVHRWIPYLSRLFDFIATEDDHSRMMVGWDLVEMEDVWTHLMLIKRTFLTTGSPLAYYVDNHTLFRVNPRQRFHFTPVGWLSSEAGITQVDRALRELSVALIFTPHSRPEAKGKIEKRFDYFQRRIPQECERYKVKNIPEAKKVIHEIVDCYNTCRIHEETGEIPFKRWQRAIKEGRSKLRRISPDINLKDIFCLEEKRVVRKDGTIQFMGKSWKVIARPFDTLIIHYIPDEEIRILKDKIILNVFKL